MSGTDLGRRAFSSPSSLGMIEESLLRSQSLLRQSTERILEYPKNVWVESSKIWRIAFPAMLTRVSTFGVLIVTQAFIGHVGATQLAAYAFIQILGVRFVNGILIGMSSATETLCGQAFDLWPVMKMSATSGIMQCLELWYTAILVLIAGYMPNASVIVSAFSICVNIVAFVFMVCLGFQASVSVRVSNELGEGNAKAASYAVKINLANSVGVGVVFAVLCLCFGRQISCIFTSEEAVVEMVSSLSVLLCLTILVYSAQPVYCGVAIGCGRQTTAAWVNFVSFYIIGIPVGVGLAYVALWEVKGMWIGLLVGLATQTVILAILVWKTNWEEQVEKAQERVNRWFYRVPGDEDDEENPTKSI
ncbi:hypothetical protein MLD38_004533 [Melastoma candidum]|uniref:Uncharacterized protein n=1 Tax=Melastoma candidum TaxID=119954 RepID=A0ACB9S6T8_9MYRT|nr:hypothetical protein MLD38_004533 [Melastoma candidum]